MNECVRIVTVVGARPQFIKAAVVSRAIATFNASAPSQRQIHEIVVHTGQHYDANMSSVFFEGLGLAEPAYNLNVGSGPHGRQTADMLERLETVLVAERPDWVLVYGDTNSTLAGAIAASKLRIPIAHVEAGLRSFQRRMPEEINRILTDAVSTLLLCPTEAAVANLVREGITRGVHRVGDVMYDSVIHHLAAAERCSDVMCRLGLGARSYLLATIHRAENTDNAARLRSILDGLAGAPCAVILPVHPRTRRIVADEEIALPERVRPVEPLPYHDMLLLEKNALAILTDSGGVQKEAYFVGVPCVTLREETEWVELLEVGANRLAGSDPERIASGIQWAMRWTAPGAEVGLYGDGHAAERIVRLLADSR